MATNIGLLVNMIKEGCENESVLLILFIFYFKTNSHKSNLSLVNKNLKWGEYNNIIMK